MDKVEVSICIPVYNAEEYIERTIESVLNQKFSNFELIIIDNCSTDNTVDKINQFKDTRIRFYKNEKNLGMVKNWNECLKKIQGKYVNIVCADDLLDKNCIMEKYKVMQSNKDIVMTVSNTNIIDINDNTIFTRRLCIKDKIMDGKKIAKKSFRTKNRFGEPTNIMFRTDVSNSIGCFNEELSYTPDWEYWLRLAKHGKIAYINNSLSKFRILPNSGSAYLLNKTKLMRQDDKIFIKSIKKVYDKDITFIDIILHKLIRNNEIIFKKSILYNIYKR